VDSLRARRHVGNRIAAVRSRPPAEGRSGDGDADVLDRGAGRSVGHRSRDSSTAGLLGAREGEGALPEGSAPEFDRVRMLAKKLVTPREPIA